MKRYLSIASYLFIALSLHSGVASANELQGIRVTGKAIIEKSPDQFSVTFTLSERGRVAQKLKASVDQQAKLLTNAAQKLGVKAKQITSSRLQIVPIYSRNKADIRTVVISDDNSSNALVGVNNNTSTQDLTLEFDVKRDVEIKLTDINDYESLLDSATKIGVKRISPVNTSISDAENLYQQALIKALEDAKAKAGQLAQNMGMVLGQVTYLEELSYRAPSRKMMAFDGGSSSAANYESFSGLDNISAEVNVIFAILPK